MTDRQSPVAMPRGWTAVLDVRESDGAPKSHPAKAGQQKGQQ